MRIIPHGLGHLESWFSAGDAIWGRLEGVALLQEVCQCVCGGEVRLWDLMPQAIPS